MLRSIIVVVFSTIFLCVIVGCSDMGAKEIKIRRGINLGNTLEAPVEGTWGFVIEEKDLQIISESGFDTVRIPIRWSAHAADEHPFTIKPEFFARVDEIIDWSLDAGVQPIINIHHYEEIFDDPEGHRERFLGLWEQISQHYQDYPNALIFEVLNEPHGSLNHRKWNPLQVEAVDLIRKTNPNRKIIMGSDEWGSAAGLKNLKLPEDTSNLIVTFHMYEPFEFTHQGAEWVEGSQKWLGRKWGSETDQLMMEILFDEVQDWQTANVGIPIFLGEFGAYSRADMASRIAWTSAVVEESEARGFGWAYWEFAAGFGIYDRRVGKFNDLHKALVPVDE